jgi:hypothetical protein
MTETQNGFRKGLSCTYLIFCLRSLIEKRRDCNLETSLLFVDYEKTFDSIQWYVLFDIQTCRNIADTWLKAIVDMYTQNEILIKLNSKLLKLDALNKKVR